MLIGCLTLFFKHFVLSNTHALKDHDKQCKSHNKEVSLDYSNLSDGKSLLTKFNILQRILKTLKLRLIFLFKNCFALVFCLTYLERVFR